MLIVNGNSDGGHSVIGKTARNMKLGTATRRAMRMEVGGSVD
jgi:hypothetical protein